MFVCICINVRVHVLKFSAVGCETPYYFTSSVAHGRMAHKPVTAQFSDGGIHAQHSKTNHHFTCTFNSDLVHNLISIGINITQTCIQSVFTCF